MSSPDSHTYPRNSSPAVILLVEDEKDVREALSAQLQDEGHQVDEAESGTEALTLLQQSPYDILLTDVMIPGVNGIELVEQIAEFQHQPVTIVMTGYGSVEMAVKAIKAGAFDFLQKPFFGRSFKRHD